MRISPIVIQHPKILILYVNKIVTLIVWHLKMPVFVFCGTKLCAFAFLVFFSLVFFLCFFYWHEEMCVYVMMSAGAEIDTLNVTTQMWLFLIAVLIGLVLFTVHTTLSFVDLISRSQQHETMSWIPHTLLDCSTKWACTRSYHFVSFLDLISTHSRMKQLKVKIVCLSKVSCLFTKIYLPHILVGLVSV